VGLRRWIFEVLDRGPAPEQDPNEQVEAAELPLSTGPLALAALERAGIAANGIEAFSIVTDTRSLMRVMVLRRDLAAAREILDSMPR
jgi:hypothetical protein